MRAGVMGSISAFSVVGLALAAMALRADPGGPPIATTDCGAGQSAQIARAQSQRPGRRQPCPGEYTEDFRLQDCTFVNQGRTTFFVLDPGYWLRLEGKDRRDQVVLLVTMLDETEIVNGIEARVMEERETVNGKLVEISRNFLTICVETGNVVYWGEDVDIYEGGVIVSHEGAWRAGVAGARPGILMPGSFLLGSRYFQEIAPGVALDRGCNTAMDLTEVTPAGTFPGCVEVLETTPLEPRARSRKVFAPGIGLVNDDGLKLVAWSEHP